MLRIMMLLSISLFFIYALRVLTLAQEIVSARWSNSRVFILTALFNTLCFFIARYFMVSNAVTIWILFFLAMVQFRVLFTEVSYLQSFFLSGMFVLLLCTSREIVLSLGALLYNENMLVISWGEQYFYSSFITLILFSLLMGWIMRRFIMDQDGIKILMRNQYYLLYASAFQLLLIIYIMVISTGMDYKRGIFTNTLTYFLLAVFGLAFWIVILSNMVKVCQIAEYKRDGNLLQEQLNVQIRHYNHHQELMGKYRRFKHDYKKILKSVKWMLDQEEYDKAVGMINDVHDELDYDLDSDKRYSNNIVLDAILQDAMRVAKEKNIEFSGYIFFPESVEISDMDLCKVFLNLMDNAFEACYKIQDDQKKFTYIRSNTKDNWLSISIENSFDGYVKYHGKEFSTTKDQREIHGIGLKIVREIIENLGGVLKINFDQEAKIFCVNLFIPVS